MTNSLGPFDTALHSHEIVGTTVSHRKCVHRSSKPVATSLFFGAANIERGGACLGGPISVGGLCAAATVEGCGIFGTVFGL